MALMIFSIWLMVEVPGNTAFPSSISPRMQPRLHMSTPLVYLWTRCTSFKLVTSISTVTTVLPVELRYPLSNQDMLDESVFSASTSWIPAESQVPCTTASPRIPSAPDSHCPLGSGWAIGPSRSHTAWWHSRCPTARWTAEGNTDKRHRQ